ncbi:MAG: WecB/TagA/CpsF family glycosyltransferase [Cyclobacteriaceae bacterium]
MNTVAVSNQSLEKVAVLSSEVSTGKFEEVLNHIVALSEKKRSSYICFANVHMIVEAFANQRFQQVINQADVVATDGLPLTKYLLLFEGINQDRVAGPDLFPELLSKAEKLGKSVYFYGNTPEVLEQMRSKAVSEYPKLKIAGVFSPPFRSLTAEEDEEIVNMINATKADFVFVSLGCPKQEQWMHDHCGRIRSCMLGVGQAFNTYAGTEKRAPLWMQRSGLEWFYRLYREPNRLAKRYLYTNAFFLYLVSRLYFRKLRNKELLPV